MNEHPGDGMFIFLWGIGKSSLILNEEEFMINRTMNGGHR